MLANSYSLVCLLSASPCLSLWIGSLSAEGEENLLVSFAAQSNPFQQLISSEEPREIDLDSPASPNSPAALRCAAAGAEVTSLLQDEIDAVKISTKREKDSSHLEVVTQAVLNGLLKNTVRYLNMIVLVPSASSDILEYLSQLYDYYYSTVFCAFVSADERARFLAVPNKTTAPAPDQSRDFEVGHTRSRSVVLLCHHFCLLLPRAIAVIADDNGNCLRFPLLCA